MRGGRERFEGAGCAAASRVAVAMHERLLTNGSAAGMGCIHVQSDCGSTLHFRAGCSAHSSGAMLQIIDIMTAHNVVIASRSETSSRTNESPVDSSALIQFDLREASREEISEQDKRSRGVRSVPGVTEVLSRQLQTIVCCEFFHNK